MGGNQQNNPYGRLRLKQTLNKARSISLIIGSVLGSGLMILPGLAYQEFGVLSFYSWLIMGIIMIPFLWVFVKLTVKYPSAGGMVNIVNEILGSRIGTAIAYMVLFATVVLVPIVAVIGANYIGYLFSLNKQMILIIAGAMLISSTLLNVFNVDLLLKIQGVSVFLLFLLLFIIITISAGHGFQAFASQVATVDYFDLNTYFLIFTGSILVFWAFLGWENLSFASEEFLDIKNDFSKSVIISFLVMMFLYLGLSLSVIGNMDIDALYTGEVPLVGVVENTIGHAYSRVVAIIGTLIMVVNLNAWVWGPSRFLYDCGRKGMIPHTFGQLNKNHIPLLSFIVLLMCYLVILVCLFISSKYALSILIKIVNTNFLTLYVLMIVSYIKSAKRLNGFFIGLTALVPMVLVLIFCGWFIVFPAVIIALSFIRQKILIQRGSKMVQQ